MKNSGDLLRSDPVRIVRESLIVCGLLVILVASAATWFFRQGYLLYYGDAQAHLNISRSIFDSRTPGYDQIGTVWLPLLHVICLPFVQNNWLWHTGLAGTIPVACCFVVAGTFFYLAAREAYASALAASVAVACFALNPNILYLASIPMTEVVFLAGLAVMLFALLRFRRTQERGLLMLGVAASWSMSLTRYDGWFLIPFAGLGFALLAKRHKWAILILFGALASLAPLYWIASNYWETGDALSFYRGPYSPVAIQKGLPYEGLHNWKLAFQYYWDAGRWCTGWPLIILGAIGAVCAVWKRCAIQLAFLLLTPIFYVWSMHSSGGTPMHLPDLPPHSYYNSRYGIAVLPLCAVTAAAIAITLPLRYRRWAIALPIICVLGWVIQPSPDHWICWKESEQNSIARRAWTQQAAQFLEANYRSGQGVLAPFGDVTGVFCASQIPLIETLHEGNGPAWLAAVSRPDLLHTELWAIASGGSTTAKALIASGSPYRVVRVIRVPGAPDLFIYKRKFSGDQ